MKGKFRPAKRAPAGGAQRSGLRFTGAIVDRGPRGPWCHLLLPPEVEPLLGKRGPVPVTIKVSGPVFRATALPDGKGGHVVIWKKELQKATGLKGGDALDGVIAIDRVSRDLPAPDDLKLALLATPAALAAFEAMPPSHRRAYIESLAEVKSSAARDRRIAKTIASMVKWGRGRGGV